MPPLLAEASAEHRIVYAARCSRSAAAQTPAMACALNPRPSSAAHRHDGAAIGRARLLFGAALALAMIGAGMVMTAPPGPLALTRPMSGRRRPRPHAGPA